MRVGIVGCGNIAEAYLSRAPLFRGIEMVAVADLDPELAASRARTYGLRAMTPDALLASDVEVVVNLTPPGAHYTVSRAILEAGKHAYSEKPLCLSLDDGHALRDMAAARGLGIGCAPDTWLGGGGQLARRMVDEGAIGRVTHGTAHVMGPGMEGWHPNPGFFFQPGGGPVLDMGPYYVAHLVNLLGPVAEVAAMANRGRDTRTIGSGPRFGQAVSVDIDTTVHALLRFGSGAVVTFGASWDVHANRPSHLELHGTEGSLVLPDPNFFGGAVHRVHGDGPTDAHLPDDHPFARPSRPSGPADYRIAGLAEMIGALGAGRTPRCGIDFALHVVEVLLAVLQSGTDGAFVPVTTPCRRPAPLPADEAAALLVADPLPARSAG